MARITDTARLDWMASNHAETEYISTKVGPGWVREAGWRVFVENGPKGSGDTLRQAIDVAMKPKEADSDNL